eukprot:gene9641-10409_t
MPLAYSETPDYNLLIEILKKGLANLKVSLDTGLSFSLDVENEDPMPARKRSKVKVKECTTLVQREEENLTGPRRSDRLRSKKLTQKRLFRAHNGVRNQRQVAIEISAEKQLVRIECWAGPPYGIYNI